MFKALLFFSIFLSSNLYANYDFSINSLCSNRDILKLEVKDDGLALGDLVVKLFEENNINYSGSKYGISSINNSPVGDKGLVLISDKEMLAFGWCYKINNTIPELMPDAIIIDKNVKSIRWYFGYAHYLDGHWLSQCEEDKDLVKKIFCK